VRTGMVACVGNDGFGTAAVRALAQAGVDTSRILIDHFEPTSLVAITRQTQTPDFLPYRGADVSVTMGSVPDDFGGAQLVHTSAFALSREPSRTTILDALSRARRAGLTVTIDPNFHSRVWRMNAETALGLLREAFETACVTKPSLDDCERLFGPGLAPEAYIERFLEWGLETVVLTMGPAGVLVATAGGAPFRLDVSDVPVVDITGAGDALWSGLIAGIIRGLPIPVAVATGMEIAEHKIQRVGQIEADALPEDLYERAAHRAAHATPLVVDEGHQSA
jgi:fructokinase